MIAALFVGRPVSPQNAARPRLHRVIAATARRQTSRPALDWHLFDAERLAKSLNRREREAFEFTLAQMHAFEAAAPKSLRVLARATPIDAVAESYLAQIDDEIAHDQLFARYRALIGASHTALHPATRLGPHAAVFVQHDPVVGAVGVTTGI